MDYTDQVKKILDTNKYMVIATAANDGKPWISPVFFAVDDKNVFYWYSRKTTKHSQLISENAKLAVVIFDSSASNDDANAVYVEGEGFEVEKNELDHALSVYYGKASKNEEEKKQMVEKPEDFLGESVLRMYKLIPKKIYTSGAAKMWNGKWLDAREEVNL